MRRAKLAHLAMLDSCRHESERRVECLRADKLVFLPQQDAKICFTENASVLLVELSKEIVQGLLA